MQCPRGVFTAYTKQDAVFWRGARRSVYGGCILLKLNSTQNFLRVDTSNTKDDTVFSGYSFCLYYARRSILGGWILLILSKTQCFRGVDTANTEQYAVF